MFRLNDIVFAYMVCFICGLQDHQNRRHQEDDLLRRLMLFRMMGYQIGETILSELEKGKEEERVYTFATFAACDCVYGYMDEEGKYKGFFSDVVETVCREAGKKCDLQFLPKSACITHQSGEIPRAGIVYPSCILL
ncbi:uncharacterized protein [Ptychodera flava]|uniref:uncharacterized protein isoform X2 n=1 Tax=Ptychodera flava TaxID=63121 RepID=UPI003969C2D0